MNWQIYRCQNKFVKEVVKMDVKKKVNKIHLKDGTHLADIYI